MLRLSRQDRNQILIFIFVAIILWMVFGPVQLGGQTAYVILTGNSMAPDFTIGDLVIARKSPAYKIDQRVVYENPRVGFVFHRIIDKDLEGFVLKGDNNDWIDSYHPTEKEVIGKFWFCIPGGGNVILKLREPVVFSFFALIILIIIASIFIFRKELPAVKRKTKNKITMDIKDFSLSRETRGDLLLLFAVTAAAALVLGGVSFTRPLTKMITEEVPYQHQGEFNYTAPDQVGIYDSRGIKTGDPIFTRLNCILDLEFSYHLSIPRMTESEEKNLEGSYQVYAVVQDIDGWNRSFSLIPETKFTGSSFETWTLLDICQVQSLFLDKEEQTAIGNRKYNLAIYPRVSISGLVQDIPIQDKYTPEISFQIDTEMMRLLDGTEGLELDQEESYFLSHEVNNTLSVFGMALGVKTARTIASIVFGIAILGAIYPAWSMISEVQKSNGARIRLQYDSLIVDVDKGSLKTKGTQVVQVESLNDLVKMAERYGAVILHEFDGKLHRYSVQDEGTLFQCSLEEIQPQED